MQVAKQSPFEGRVVFSIWDQGGCDTDKGACPPDQLAQTVACGSGVKCTVIPLPVAPKRCPFLCTAEIRQRLLAAARFCEWTCQDFGGEGTGRKSIVYSNDLPARHESYYVVTHGKQVGRLFGMHCAVPCRSNILVRF